VKFANAKGTRKSAALLRNPARQASLFLKPIRRIGSTKFTEIDNRATDAWQAAKGVPSRPRTALVVHCDSQARREKIFLVAGTFSNFFDIRAQLIVLNLSLAEICREASFGFDLMDSGC